MALSKRFEFKQEILPTGVIQVRTSEIITEDGADIATKYYRYILKPGDDVSEEPAEIQAVANAIWTTEKIDNYRSLTEESE